MNSRQNFNLKFFENFKIPTKKSNGKFEFPPKLQFEKISKVFKFPPNPKFFQDWELPPKSVPFMRTLSLSTLSIPISISSPNCLRLHPSPCSLASQGVFSNLILQTQILSTHRLCFWSDLKIHFYSIKLRNRFSFITSYHLLSLSLSPTSFMNRSDQYSSLISNSYFSIFT